MTVIASTGTALPGHCYPQRELTDAFADLVLEDSPDRRTLGRLLTRLHTNAQVSSRHMALPLDRYPKLADFGAANDAFIEVGTELGVQAVRSALEQAGLEATDVDLVMFTTVTGVAAPSLDARIAPLIGFRPDVKRVPMFGLGCVAGAAGIARVHDYLAGHPNDVAVLLSVELCSLTIQPNDLSTANLVASGLFGDGASAVVLVGDSRVSQLSLCRPPPEVVDSRSHLYPDTERTMGWDIGSSGMKIVLNAEVPDLVEKYLAADAEALLDAHNLLISDVTGWVCHPGGPKVIEAIENALGLVDGELELTWRSLASVGNLSSSSVLHVLSDTLSQREFPRGSPGMLIAMGPGFCAELVLLRW
jgi:alkylresorcinol/alkylpyrone synthase